MTAAILPVLEKSLGIPSARVEGRDYKAGAEDRANGYSGYVQALDDERLRRHQAVGSVLASYGVLTGGVRYRRW